MTSIVPLLCLVLMVYSVVRSLRKLRTLLYGVLAIGVTLGVLFILGWALSLNAAIMGHVAFVLVFVIPAYVMWTHARSTEKLTPAQKITQEKSA
jgi:cobalamin biosynthesis protein CobD/CbiB